MGEQKLHNAIDETFSAIEPTLSERIRSHVSLLPTLKQFAHERENILLDLKEHSVLSGGKPAYFELWGVLEHHRLPTAQHCERVAGYVRLMGSYLDPLVEGNASLQHASRLHDIGKLLIPEYLLKKKELSSFHRMLVVEGHAVLGEFLCKYLGIDDPSVRNPIVYHHDVKDGYPHNLDKAQSILDDGTQRVIASDMQDSLVIGDLLSFADSADAIVDPSRTYQQHLTPRAAFERLTDITHKRGIFPQRYLDALDKVLLNHAEEVDEMYSKCQFDI